MAQWSHRYARINGIRMHFVEQGAGTPVILCHGFPHFWFSWRHQIPVIAQAGWRVIAPDLRGMGQTDAPAEVAAYDVPQITGDLLGLLDAIDESARSSSVSISVPSRFTTWHSAHRSA
jgi:pimeloyl-ACP methyl ester carboxylesterase